jgi:hypothetical protein
LFGSEQHPVGRLEIRPNEIADDQLRSWTYGAKLRWAADQRGRLTDRRKLKRIRRVSGYRRGWEHRVAERDWQEVLAEARQYRAEPIPTSCTQMIVRHGRISMTSSS